MLAGRSYKDSHAAPRHSVHPHGGHHAEGSAADRDAYMLRRRVNLIMAALFLAMNLLLLAIVTPAIIDAFRGEITGGVEAIPLPDNARH